MLLPVLKNKIQLPQIFHLVDILQIYYRQNIIILILLKSANSEFSFAEHHIHTYFFQHVEESSEIFKNNIYLITVIFGCQMVGSGSLTQSVVAETLARTKTLGNTRSLSKTF